MRRGPRRAPGAQRSLDEMGLPDPNQLQREAEREKRRSHSIGPEYGSIRFTEWVTAKDSRRKQGQGRIAVSSESELELRTKLSQLPTSNSASKKDWRLSLCSMLFARFSASPRTKMSTEQLLRTVQYMEGLTLQRGDQLVN